MKAYEVVAEFLSLPAEDRKDAAKKTGELLGEDHPLAKAMQQFAEADELGEGVRLLLDYYLMTEEDRQELKAKYDHGHRQIIFEELDRIVCQVPEKERCEEG